MFQFNYCPDRPINPPAEFFENDAIDYDVYRCGHCGDVHSTGIYQDTLTNDNVCENCLNNEDFAFFHDMTEAEFNTYSQKVRKRSPINPI